MCVYSTNIVCFYLLIRVEISNSSWRSCENWLSDFKKRVVELIEGGAYTGKVRWILRAVSITIVLRWRLKVSVIYPFLNFALTTGSEAHSRLISFFPKVGYFLAL